MNFKNILTAGLLTSVLLATGAYVQADIVINDNEQTIDNSLGGSIDNSTTMDIDGTLGFDNTDPESPEPSDPDKWLNVTLPLKTAFFTAAEDLTDIVAVNHTIKNHSGRPVKISTASYTVKSGDITPIKLLTLETSLNSSIKLIEDGVVNTSSTELMTLASPNARPTDLQGDSTATFTYDGTVDSGFTLPSGQSSTSISSTLTFDLEALKEDGNPY